MKNFKFRLQYYALLLLILMARFSAFAQITPSQDSYINTASAATNYGSATTLDVVSSASSIQTTYVKFDLSSIPSSYRSGNVAKATLKLFVNSVTAAGSFNVDFVNGNWSEKTITADLLPALGTTIKGSVPLTSSSVNNYITIDLTAAVDEWLNGTQANDGIALVPNSGLSATFQSKENTNQSHPAELDIVFTDGATLTGVTTASGSGLTGGGTSGDLNLSLLKTCTTNQVLQWNGSAWMCATVSTSGGTGTISGVKAGTDLTGGGTTGTVTLNLDTTKVPQLSSNNTFSGSQTINNQVLITASTGTEALGVSANGANVAVFGTTSTTSGAGIIGLENATTGTGVGVGGSSASPNGAGVAGSGATGVQGTATIFASSGAGGGVFAGFSAQPNSLQPGTPGIIVTGGSGDPDSTQTGPNGAEGLHATGGNGWVAGDGITGRAGQVSSGSNIPAPIGVVGYGGTGRKNEGGPGVEGYGGPSPTIDAPGGYFAGASNSQFGDGIDGVAGSGYAGWFNGDVSITGTLSTAVKNFKIDHPLDPANKYLVHASVESSEMMNIYTGNVVTDAQGEATVTLPDWFEALNSDFRYQLTVVGQFAQVIVGHEIENHQFQIKTNAPSVKVSWQVTGVRQDAFAKAHPLVVEQEKEAMVKGFYIHPELYGASDEKQIEWARHPAMMKRMKEQRAKAAPELKAVSTTKP